MTPEADGGTLGSGTRHDTIQLLETLGTPVYASKWTPAILRTNKAEVDWCALLQRQHMQGMLTARSNVSVAA